MAGEELAQLDIQQIIKTDEEIFREALRYWIAKQSALHMRLYRQVRKTKDKKLTKLIQEYRALMRQRKYKQVNKKLQEIIKYADKKDLKEIYKYAYEISFERKAMYRTRDLLNKIKKITPSFEDIVKLVDEELFFLIDLQDGIRKNLPEREDWIDRVETWIRRVESKALVKPEETVNYALKGDTKNRYPYKFVIQYGYLSPELTYENLIEALKKRLSYLLERKELTIKPLNDFIVWKYNGKPALYLQRGGYVYVSAFDHTYNTPLTFHHAGYILTILNSLGFVVGYTRRRERMSEEEIAWVMEYMK